MAPQLRAGSILKISNLPIFCCVNIYLAKLSNMNLSSWDSCSDTFWSMYINFPLGAAWDEVVSVNFTHIQLRSIYRLCWEAAELGRESKVEEGYSKPMAWIGIYIAVASLICILAMVADLWNGFRYRKFWFPSKYFSLNAVSITLISVAMKLPMDLNTKMGGEMDQTAKLGSLVFMCTMIANLMPSLASIDNKELPVNVIGLAILIITIIVNVIMEMFTGVVDKYWVNLTCAYVAMLLFLLIVLMAFAISVPISKQKLEVKYQAISKITLNDQHAHDRFIIERLRQHVKRYGIMVQTGSPQFVMASNVLSCGSGVICGFGLVIYILHLWQFITYRFMYLDELLYIESQYKWSTYAIFTTQFLGVLVGSIAPILRCTTAVTSFKSLTRWNIKHFMIFKVEKYWTQKLYEWKESHISFLLGGRRSRSLFRNLKKPILILWIGIQMASVVTCKMICLIPIGILILVTYCSDFIKYYLKETLLDTTLSDVNTNEDLSRYVLLLEDNVELAKETLKRISHFVNRLIRTAEKKQDNNLLKLLEKSIGFEGVLKFDTYQVQPPIFLELPNCWSLPVATLTCIAISLPNIRSDKTDNLLKSVGEALSYTHLIDKSLKSACNYLNVQEAAMTLWDEVEDNCRWLGNTLEKSAYEGKTSKEILEWFAQKAEEVLNAGYNSAMEESMENIPQKLIVANSMKRIAQTIIATHNISEITKKQLFDLLSRIIADILFACFTNIPRVITMKCHQNAIEKREASVEAAATLLGRTTKIIKIIAQRELPSMDPEKLAFVDEWRLFLQHIP